MSDAKAKPSGAANRKRRKDEQARERERSDNVAGSWLSQPAYCSTGEQWDPNAPPVSIPIYGVPAPTLVKVINQAVYAMTTGAFQSAAILWDGMLADERIASALTVRNSGLLGSNLELEPANDDDPAHEVMEDCERIVGKMLPAPQIAQLQRWGWGIGVGIAQRKTARAVKSWTPTLETWNPRYLRFDQLLRRYCLVTQNRGEIVLEPDDPEWLIYEPYGPMGWMHGAMLRPLALPYAIRYWARTWWARRQEVHGEPIRLGIIPATRNPADERTFMQQITNLAHEAVIRLPQGADGNKFDVKLLEASSTDWEGFQKLIEHCDASIAIAILGQSQSTEGQGGLGNQERAGESTLVRLLKGDAQIGDVLREKLIEPWAEDNHGDRELAPYVGWELDPPDDLEKKSKSLLTVAQSIEVLARVPEAKACVDFRALLEEYQLPMLAVADQAPVMPDAITAPVSSVNTPATGDTEREAVPTETVAAEGDTVPKDDAAAAATLAITPSAMESIVKVDEGRQSVGLPPVGGEVGGLYIREQAARIAAALPSAKPETAPVEEAPAENGSAGPVGDEEAGARLAELESHLSDVSAAHAGTLALIAALEERHAKADADRPFLESRHKAERNEATRLAREIERLSAEVSELKRSASEGAPDAQE